MIGDYSFRHITYSEKLFKERLLTKQHEVDLIHIGPMMFLCSDEMGMWIAIVRQYD